MSDTGVIPQAVRDLAAGIADDIERNGPYVRGGKNIYMRFTPDAPCCIVQSPTYLGCFFPATVRGALAGVFGVTSLVEWYDNHTPDEALSALRKIASGVRP
jgi:hypothetical protein